MLVFVYLVLRETANVGLTVNRFPPLVVRLEGGPVGSWRELFANIPDAVETPPVVLVQTLDQPSVPVLHLAEVLHCSRIAQPEGLPDNDRVRGLGGCVVGQSKICRLPLHLL